MFDERVALRFGATELGDGYSGYIILSIVFRIHHGN